jgi:hypothetical protein
MVGCDARSFGRGQEFEVLLKTTEGVVVLLSCRPPEDAFATSP